MGLHQTAIGIESIKNVNWQDKKILDVGCGDGKLSLKVLNRTKARELIGVDIDEKEISKAKKIKDLRLSFLVADSSSLPFDNEEFDAIFCNIAFQQFENKEKSLREMYRVLKNKGEIIINFIEEKSDILEETIKILKKDFGIELDKKGSKIKKQEFENLAKNSGFKVEYSQSKNDTFFFKNSKLFFLGYRDTINAKIKRLSPEQKKEFLIKLERSFIKKRTEDGIRDTWHIVVVKLNKQNKNILKVLKELKNMVWQGVLLEESLEDKSLMD